MIYVVRSGARLADLGRGVGEPGEGINWLLLTVGCVLLFFLIVGLTYQLAQAVAARRYALKQEEFLSDVTHEMKSPLAAIKLHAQTLLQQDADATTNSDRGNGDSEPAMRRRFLTLDRRQADRMTALVDAVLESSRLLARKRALSFSPFDVDEFLARYLPRAEPWSKGAVVELRCAGHTQRRHLRACDRRSRCVACSTT